MTNHILYTRLNELDKLKSSRDCSGTLPGGNRYIRQPLIFYSQAGTT